MNITNLAATWIEQHRDEIEDHGKDYSWIPGECAAYKTLEEVMEAFGKAGIEPFNLYQGSPKDLYRYIWYSCRGIRYAIFIPDPVLTISNSNFQTICKTNAEIARVLGLHVYKYKGDVFETMCPYIICNPELELQDRYLEEYKSFIGGLVYSTKASDYELVEEYKTKLVGQEV